MVGYSGVNDALFKKYFTDVKEFRGRLFWSAYAENEDTKKIKEVLFKTNNHASYMCGLGADEFFQNLARELGVSPPLFLKKPFTYVKELLGNITLPEESGASYALGVVLKMIQQGIPIEESYSTTDASTTAGKTPAVPEANFALMGGDYERVITLYNEADESGKQELEDIVAWAYIGQGNASPSLISRT